MIKRSVEAVLWDAPTGETERARRAIIKNDVLYRYLIATWKDKQAVKSALRFVQSYVNQAITMGIGGDQAEAIKPNGSTV